MLFLVFTVFLFLSVSNSFQQDHRLNTNPHGTSCRSDWWMPQFRLGKRSATNWRLQHFGSKRMPGWWLQRLNPKPSWWVPRLKRPINHWFRWEKLFPAQSLLRLSELTRRERRAEWEEFDQRCYFFPFQCDRKRMAIPNYDEGMRNLMMRFG